jgi:hypothetical protein
MESCDAACATLKTIDFAGATTGRDGEKGKFFA